MKLNLLRDVRGSGAAGKVIADMAAAAVSKNNVIFGSVNANKRHWYRAGAESESSRPQVAQPVDLAL